MCFWKCYLVEVVGFIGKCFMSIGNVNCLFRNEYFLLVIGWYCGEFILDGGFVLFEW